MCSPLPSLNSTPFPWPPMLAIAAALLAHGFALTSLFPYVGYMVQFLGVTDDKDKAGYYAGYISGAFMIGRMLSSYFWGVFSDKKGRKPALFIALSGMIVFDVLFGLATNFWVAISARIGLGLFNGIVGISRTLISEVCGKEHEVVGMGFLTGTWSLGFVLGPALGGLLAEPAVQYPHVFSQKGLLGRYPYLLPNLVAAALASISLPLIMYFVQETRFASDRASFTLLKQREEEEEDAGGQIELMEQGDRPPRAHTIDTAAPPPPPPVLSTPPKELGRWSEVLEKRVRMVRNSLSPKRYEPVSCAEAGEAERAPLDGFAPQPSPGDRSERSGGRSRSRVRRTPSGGVISEKAGGSESGGSGHGDDLQYGRSCSGESDRDSGSWSKRAGRRRQQHRVTWKEELVECRSPDPTHAAAEAGDRGARHPGEPARGNFSRIIHNRMARRLLVIYGIFSLVSIMWDEVYPLWALSTVVHGGLNWTSGQIGRVLSFSGLFMVVFQIFIYPRVAKALGVTGAVKRCSLLAVPLYLLFPLVAHLHGDGVVLYATQVLMVVLIKCCSNVVFASLALITNNCVGTDLRGSLNGLNMTIGSFAKASGPAVGSLLFAFSISSGRHPFPLDFHMVFYLLAILLAFVAFLIRRYIPDEMIHSSERDQQARDRVAADRLGEPPSESQRALAEGVPKPPATG